MNRRLYTKVGEEFFHVFIVIEAAAILKVPSVSIRRWIRKGTLNAIKISRDYLVIQDGKFEDQFLALSKANFPESTNAPPIPPGYIKCTDMARLKKVSTTTLIRDIRAGRLTGQLHETNVGRHGQMWIIKLDNKFVSYRF